MCQLRLLPSLITSSWIKNSTHSLLCISPGYLLEALHGADPGRGIGHLQLRMLKTGGGDVPVPAHPCLAGGEGTKSEAIRDFPLSSKPCKLILTPLPSVWARLSVWASGHSPLEPARAGALFQRRAPASQQDECRFGSQAGDNPRSLVWLCAPADPQPGLAVIPTSCCRSLISWSQPGKETTKTQTPNCCG